MKIALFGRMGSGKSDLGARLAFKKVAFGDAVKDEFLRFQIGSSRTKIEKSIDRPFLQNYGQLRRGELESFLAYNNDVVCLTVTEEGKMAKKMLIGASGNAFADVPLGLSYYDCWVDKALPRIKALIEIDAPILNDDIRRWNEWHALKQLGFLMIKVETSPENRIKRMKLRDGGVNLDTLEDISESEIDELPYDFLIENNDTINLAWNSLSNVIN